MIGIFRFLIVYLLLIGAWVFIRSAAVASVPIPSPLSSLPSNLGEWRTISQLQFSAEILGMLKPTDYLYRTYAGPDGRKITLYVGYHDGGEASGEIHSPRHCLPGSGWEKLSGETLTVATARGPVHCTKCVYRKGEVSEMFLYWFHVKGKSLASEYSLKLAEVANAITSGRRDAAFVRVSLPVDADESSAEKAATGFIREMYPWLGERLPL